MISTIDLGRKPDDLRNLLWRRNLRLWREAVAANEAQLAEVLASAAFGGRVREFCGRRTEVGRRKILLRICAMLDRVAEFQAARLRNPPRGMWGAIALEEAGARVECVGIGENRIVREPWNLKVREHALERFYQRQPAGADLSEALLEAHENATLGRLYRLEHGEEVLVPAGAGVFRGMVAPGGLDRRGVVTAWTWVNDDMLTAGQRAWLEQPARRHFLYPVRRRSLVVQVKRLVPGWDDPSRP